LSFVCSIENARAERIGRHGAGAGGSSLGGQAAIRQGAAAALARVIERRAAGGKVLAKQYLVAP
jgi:hypothetical protein